jgi:transcriptional regulator with XRE-family HTH domain
MLLVRQEIGDVLRDVRQRKGHTLRQVASRASVALGYLSEVERGQKEASSEILASVAEALDVPISQIMREVADRLAFSEGIPAAVQNVYVPDVIPDELVASYSHSDSTNSAVLDARTIVAAAQARPRAGFVRH